MTGSDAPSIDITNIPDVIGATGNKPEAGFDVMRSPTSVTTAISEHTTCQKICFSASYIGVSNGSQMLSVAREIYVLQLGADANLLGTLNLAFSWWGPICYPLSGYCMDKELLSRWFDKERWGRRAPWYLTHLLMLAVLVLACYLPPSNDSVGLVIWMVIISLLGNWCCAVLYVAYDCARAELYPVKQDVIIVETYTKVSYGIGAGVATLVMNAILSAATFTNRLAASIGLGVFTLVSLIALPPYRDAHREADPELISSLGWESWTALKKPAVFHFVGLLFWQAVAQTALTTFILYHLTYNCELIGNDRQVWVIIIGGGTITVEAAAVLLFNYLFRAGFLDMQVTCAVSFFLCAIVAPLQLLYLPLDRRWNFFIYIILENLAFSPQTYFRIHAYCCIVDEDSLETKGKRREGIFGGLSKLLQNVGGALAGALLFFGMSQLGLVANDCQQTCSIPGTAENCSELCDRANVDAQPDVVRRYVEMMYTIVVPISQALCVFHTVCFPIRGQRLARLVELQEQDILEQRSKNQVSECPVQKTDLD